MSPLDESIRRGLTMPQKQLPSAMLYDALGSMLFEAITFLPEYGVTRAGVELLQRHRDEMVAGDGELELVELGPGAGRKARLLVEAALKRQPTVHFVGVDVSAQALDDCQFTLEQLDGVTVEKVQASYLEGLERSAQRRRPGVRRLVLFLGSNLSNFDRPEAQRFLREVRARLRPGDALLLATDLDKDPARLLPAYDDALGVTAAFDKNALVRLNREWGADFPLDAFVHRSRWNAQARRVEMHLEAQRALTVRVGALDLTVTFAPGETIWTESSHRFSLDELRTWAAEAGFCVARQWLNDAWPFAQTFLTVT